MPVPTTVVNFVRSPGRHTAAGLVAGLRNRRLLPGSGPPRPKPHEVPQGPSPAEVVVYFADDPRRLYQLEQWLPVLERLHERRPVLLVLRSLPTLRALAGRTTLPHVFVRRLGDLMDLYGSGDHKVALYVNNGVSNFQSLAVPSMLHVHVNHGESDKLSMVSNQAKAYDRVFVAGRAAVERHRAALIGLDESRLVPVGRPQLDLSFADPLPPCPGRTVIYAPTWEGENDFNNYTSVDRFGPAIVRALLSVPDVRVVYRPHPRIATSAQLPMVRAHGEIVAAIERAARERPGAGHLVNTAGSILALFGAADALVTDVSSVGLDFLYLRTERPILLTDRRDDRAGLLADAPIAAAADVIDGATVGDLAATVAARLLRDERRADRERLRRYYFGGVAPGESTERFLAAVGDVAEERDKLLAARPAHHERPGAAVAALGVSESSASEVDEPASADR